MTIEHISFLKKYQYYYMFRNRELVTRLALEQFERNRISSNAICIVLLIIFYSLLDDELARSKRVAVLMLYQKLLCSTAVCLFLSLKLIGFFFGRGGCSLQTHDTC